MAYPTGLRIQTSIDRRVGAHLRFIALSPQVDKSIIVCDGWPALFTNPAVTCAAFNLTSPAATNLPSNTPPKRRNGRQLGWLRRHESWQPLLNGCYVSSLAAIRSSKLSLAIERTHYSSANTPCVYIHVHNIEIRPCSR